jgi:hypothetical protein
MAVAANRQLITLKAGADLSAATNQYTLLKMSDDNTVVQATAGADNIVGILQNCPANGAAASVCIGGRSKLRASAAIADGAAVTATTGGKGVTTTTAGNCIAGRAVTTVANADEIVEVLIDITRVPA